MKVFLVVLSIAFIASVTRADRPVQIIESVSSRVDCSLVVVSYDWNFAEGDGSFTTAQCDDGGAPVWEYGLADYWPDPMWVTVVEGDYPNDVGESLVSPSFIVDESAYLVEVLHGYDIDPGWDGGNLSVNGVVVEPMDGYPDDEISDSVDWYAWCVDGELGFTGFSGFEPITSCFDLSAFMGEEVQLSFDFGSDSSVNYPGWYLGYVRVGGDVVANDGTTWSAMKGLYR